MDWKKQICRHQFKFLYQYFATYTMQIPLPAKKPKVVKNFSDREVEGERKWSGKEARFKRQTACGLQTVTLSANNF
jgi:hypothetical protein